MSDYSNGKFDTPITRDAVIKIRQQAATLDAEWNQLTNEQHEGRIRLSHIKERLFQIESIQRASKFNDSDQKLKKTAAAAGEEHEPLQAEADALNQRFTHIQARLRDIPLKRLQASWDALEAELLFASQGSGDLMNHPGYTEPSSEGGWPPHVALNDITEDMHRAANTHKSAMIRFEAMFSEEIAATDAQIKNFQSELAAMAELEKQREELRKQRQLAIAGGQGLAGIDAALLEVDEQTANKRGTAAHIEDEIAGLMLRKTELAKAQTQIQKSLQNVAARITLMDVCFIAQKYNQHAEMTADLFRQFEKSTRVTNGRSLSGAPGVSLGCECSIPRILLPGERQSTRRGAKELFFYKSGHESA